MSDYFVGEIRIFGFNFAPQGWTMCQGQLLQISQYNFLFQMIGTTYGGDGVTTFAVPNMQGNAPMHHGQGPALTERLLGETGGDEAVTLTQSQIPAHTHSVRATESPATLNAPGPTRGFGRSVGGATYQTSNLNQVALTPEAIAPSGGGGAHNNMQPYLTLNFCIALNGIPPPHP